LLVELVESGKLSEARVDGSVRRTLRKKLLLSLFDSPRVDEDAAVATVGRADFVKLGNEVQRKSYMLLTNKDDILPLKPAKAAPSFYVQGFNTGFMAARTLPPLTTQRKRIMPLCAWKRHLHHALNASRSHFMLVHSNTVPQSVQLIPLSSQPFLPSLK
jgi:beta-glucosidase-like glycosyl hydrolase